MEIGEIRQIDTKIDRMKAIEKYPILIEHPHLEENFCKKV